MGEEIKKSLKQSNTARPEPIRAKEKKMSVILYEEEKFLRIYQSLKLMEKTLLAPLNFLKVGINLVGWMKK